MANHQNAATLGVALSLETGNFVTEANKAAQETQKLKNAIAREMRAADKEIQALKYATEDYGKALTKVSALERELSTGRLKNLEKSEQGKEKANQLRAEAAAYDAKVASMKKMNGVLSEQQKLAVTYQVTDFFTQIASGQNAMIAFIQQGGQLKDQMGGIGGALRALGSLFTPFNVIVGGSAAALGAFGYALYQAHKEMADFKDAMSLTGQYAGIAYAEFVKLGEVLSQKTGTSIGEARDAMQALVSSGAFTRDTITSVGRAVLNFSKVTGVDAKDAAKQLIPLLDGTSASAKTLNDKYHFLTLEQYKYIEALEKQGKLQESAKLQADALSASIEKTARNLGYLETLWKNIKEWASKAWDAMLGFGREPGMDRAQELEKKINQLTTWLEARKGKISAAETKEKEATLQRMKNELAQLVGKIGGEMDVVEAAAKKAAEETDKINNWKKAGGDAARRKLAEDAAKLELEAKFKAQLALASEQRQIEIELEQKIGLARLEEAKKNEETLNQFTNETARIRKAKIQEAEAEAEKKRVELRKKTFLQELDAEMEALRHKEAFDKQEEQRRQDALQDAFKSTENAKMDVDLQKDKLNLQMQMIGATEKEAKIAELKLQSEKEIAQWKKSQEYKLLSDTDKDFYENRKREVVAVKLANLELEESLKRLQGAYDVMWNNMSSAIENFVRTGKFSIKDFTRSVIQDFLVMQMKLQAMSLVRSLIGSFSNWMSMKSGGGWGTGNAYGNQDLGRFFADGGSPPVGVPSVVGERGPELFIPRTAGTIIPNDKIGGMMGGTTNITNNYIDAIDVQSFEQRLLGSSNAVWAANQYANKSLAVGRGRA